MRVTPRSLSSRVRSGFTLIELLTATALTIIIMTLLTGVFSQVTDSVNNSRSMIEMNSQIGAAVFRLQRDLEGYTVNPDPNRKQFNDGYVEVQEGPVGPVFWTYNRTTLVTAIPAPALTPPLYGDPAAPPYADSRLGDMDDVMLLTTRSKGDSFVGKFGTTTFSSDIAEVAWFVRGTTLYRRMLLVGTPTVQAAIGPPVPVAWIAPAAMGPNYSPYLRLNDSTGTVVEYTGNQWNLATEGFYGFTDLSAHFNHPVEDLDQTDRATGPRMVANSLADLTHRKNRFVHQPFAFPHALRFWSEFDPATFPGQSTGMGLPTMGETTDPSFPWPRGNGAFAGVTFQRTIDVSAALPDARFGTFDPQTNPFPFPKVPPPPTIRVDGQTGRLTAFPNGGRVGEDVILTNVIGFDVKVWDPRAPIYQTATDVVLPGDMTYRANLGVGTPVGFGAFVDLGYGPGYVPPVVVPPHPQPEFNGIGAYVGAINRPELHAVYDSWSSQYESDGIDNDGDGLTDEATDGYDNNGVGGVDDVTEREAPPPYRHPLRGIQITLRVFDPDSQQVREVTIRQDFIME